LRVLGIGLKSRTVDTPSGALLVGEAAPKTHLILTNLAAVAIVEKIHCNDSGQKLFGGWFKP